MYNRVVGSDAYHVRIGLERKTSIRHPRISVLMLHQSIIIGISLDQKTRPAQISLQVQGVRADLAVQRSALDKKAVALEKKRFCRKININ